MKVPNILKIIYAPHKAFKEIAENPSYLGPILIVILFIGANVGLTYVGGSKAYFERTLPDGLKQDEWTQNSTFWTSNANGAESSDCVNATYPANVRAFYGDKSIAFSINNTAQVWMQLNRIGSINCSSPDGYDRLTFRLKQTAPQEKPRNVTVYLFSRSPADYFYYDLTQNLSNSTPSTWNNLTIPLVSGWSAGSLNADWGNITGLKLEATWLNNSNVTLLVDGLFFLGPFKATLESEGTSYMLNIALVYAMQFVITWVILSGVLYLLSKTLGAKLVWRLLLIIIGCILITMVVQAVANIAAWASLPNVKVPFELFGGIPSEGQAASSLISEQTAFVTLFGSLSQIAMYVWTIALAGAAVHLLGELSWTKSFLAATVAYVATLFVAGFLFG